MEKIAKKIKLIALDLDGTLLNSKKEISEYTLRVLNKKRNENYIVVVITGRMYCASKPFVQRLGIDTYVGTYQGACVYDPTTDKRVYNCGMDTADVLRVVDDCMARGIYFQLVGDDEFYFREHCEYSDHYSTLCSKPGHAVENIRDFASKMAVTKIIAMATKDVVPGEYEFFSKKYQGELQVVTSNPRFIEFTNKSVSKKTALEFIAGHYGVKMDEVISFGDQLNDLSMIEGAGIGVAMGNAHSGLKEKADIVTLTNDEDGVAYTLENLL